MVCAHGGDTTHAPPNTVSAFRASLAAGADCVEIDAALSRDEVLVVMHVRELAQLLGRGGVQVREGRGEPAAAGGVLQEVDVLSNPLSKRQVPKQMQVGCNIINRWEGHPRE